LIWRLTDVMINGPVDLEEYWLTELQINYTFTPKSVTCVI